MAAEMQLDRLEEILARLTALQENQAMLIEKQHTSLAFLTNSVKDFSISLRNLDGEVEKCGTRNQNLVAENQSHSPINSDFSQPWHENFPAHDNQFRSINLNVSCCFGENLSNSNSRIRIQDRLKIGLHNMDSKLEQYIGRNNNTPSEIPPPSPIHLNLQPEDHNFPEQANQLKSMRLEVPRFSGDNSSAWISRIQRYFDFYKTPDPQRLIIAYFHLDGDALEWYDWMKRNQLISTWNEFLLALDKRFSSIQKHMEAGKVDKSVPVIESCMMSRDPADSVGTVVHPKVFCESELGNVVKVFGHNDRHPILDASGHSTHYIDATIQYEKNIHTWEKSSIMKRVTIEDPAGESLQGAGRATTFLAQEKNNTKAGAECTKGNLDAVASLVKADRNFELHGTPANRFRSTHM